jgi:hypothetical protein
MKKFHERAIAIAALLQAVVTLLLAFEVIDPQVGAAITGLIGAGLVAIRSFVTPVEKVAILTDKPFDVVNDLLKAIKL